MQPLRIVLMSVAAICAVSATVWISRYSPWGNQPAAAEGRIARRLRAAKEVRDLNAGVVPPQLDRALTGPDRAIESPPPPAEGSKLPKVETGRTVYEFGSMLMNEEKRHTFRIENKGDAPLVLAKGPTECICTISALSNREVPPGGFAEVELRWKPPAADSEFAKSAIFWTNDPKRPHVRFSISGRVAPLAVIMPGIWNAGTVTDEKEGRAVGTISSEVVDHFQIVSVKSVDPNVHVEFKSLAPEVLKRARIRSGYEFMVTVGKGIRLGHWRSRLQIGTSLEGSKTIDVEVAANRSGPIEFLPAIPIVGRAYWDADRLLLNMDRFSRATGSKAAVPAIVDAMHDNLQIQTVSSSYPFLKVSLERDPAITAGKRQGVRFVFEVPSGGPPVTRLPCDPIHVSVKTNHPTIHQIDFELAFVAS
jgi:Protein of unknown function (DUF1573)